jgi:hypothetical protein
MHKISYSQYSTWKTCPLFWKLRYVDELKIDDVSINTVFGTAIHRIVQEWLGDILFAKSVSYARSIDLSGRFQQILVEELKPYIKLEDGTFLCSREEVDEYYQQGLEIISFIQQNSKKIFPTEDVKLVGIELELEHPIRENLVFVGYLDIVTTNIKTGMYTIHDLKTSRRGWRDQDRNNPVKRSQLLLYKKFFAEQHAIPLDKVNVEFLILKRIVEQNGLYKNPRVSRFVPPNSNMSINKTWKEFSEFLDTCYDMNGNFITDKIKPAPNKSNCKYCPFKDRKDLCSVGVK